MTANELSENKREKVLLIDDSRLKIEVTKRAIIDHYDVMTAVSGQEALAVLESETPDLILLDIEMPEMSGYEVMRKIMNTKRLKDIPVIFLTSRTDENDEIYGLSLGAVDYIRVPFSTPTLLKRLELHLALVKQRKELHMFNQDLMKMVDERTTEIEKSREELRLARDVAEAASRVKSVFLANTSHELRTPLNSIIGFTELALADDIPGKTKDYLKKVLENAQWLLKIINDILEMSNIESGKIILQHVSFDLQDLIAQCRANILPKAAEKGIKLDCYVEPSIYNMHNMLYGDPARLREALSNLLSNAVKFTKQGIVSLYAYAENSDENSITIRFEVKDTGIGMTPEQINRIYEPFIQADEGTTKKFGGTGLGLTIAKDIIELMGGLLKVDSVIGVGSKFSFNVTFSTVA